MSGFGKKKKENKGSSKKLLQLSQNELKAKSINYHKQGDLKKAENGYLAFIKNGYSDADVFSNYALICEKKGEITKAIKLYERCIDNFPSHIFSKLNLAFLHYKLKDLRKAEILVNDAISRKPSLANSYCIKGLILKSMHKYNESRSLLNKAIEIDPNYYDAYINLGLLCKDYNNYSEAINYYLKAIAINNKSAIAHLNLGACYKEVDKIDEAILNTKIAIELDNELENSYLNLATIYYGKGDYSRSLSLVKKELSINKNNELCYQLLGELIKKVELEDCSESENREVFRSILNRKDISHRELFGNINKLFSTKQLEKLSASTLELSQNNELLVLINDKELMKALKLMIFCSPLWEKALKNIRKNILMSYSDKMQISDNLLNFTVALGSQCFLNEYVYYISEEEKNKLIELKKTLHKKDHQDFKIALISCYQSLFSISSEIIDLTSYKYKNKVLDELIEMQLKEILKEKQLSNQIKKIGSISDLISMEVKNQYELNPYPRWRYNSFSKDHKINFITAINSEIHPNKVNSNNLEFTENKINVLIAGCGTGIQILEASRYRNCEITAIDLSNASIAYAKRKIEEYGMKNVDLIEMDILELSKLNKKFDLIECSGVLHHMKDPAQGLAHLTESLKTNGFLKIGLYSTYARVDIQEARELIKENKIKPRLNEIRNFRNDVLNGDMKNFKKITKWSDFYSTSMCRDLCFHTQEKSFTLIEIKNLLERNHIQFLGFTLKKEIRDLFQINYKDIDSLKDLELWNKFEQTHPNSFGEMYQFWTRKSIK